MSAIAKLPTWHCEDHQVHEPDCRKCTDRRHVRKRAPLDPGQFENLGLDIQTATSGLTARYSELFELAHDFGSSQQGEQVSGGGFKTGRISDEAVSAFLHDAGQRTMTAWEAIQHANSHLTAAEKAIDHGHSDGAPAGYKDEPALRSDIVFTRLRQRSALIEKFAADLAKIDDEVLPLFKRIDPQGQESLVIAMETQAVKLRQDSEKMAARLEREAKTLRHRIKVAKDKAKAAVQRQRQSSGWTKVAESA